MVKENRGSYYNNDMLKEAEEDLQKEMKEEIRREEEKIRRKYQQEIEIMFQMMIKQRDQGTDPLQNINDMVMLFGGSYYTNDIQKEMEWILQEKEEDIKRGGEDKEKQQQTEIMKQQGERGHEFVRTQSPCDLVIS